jgi:hypothetical protein
MTNQVGYAGGGTGTEDTNNRPSRNIWKGSPFNEIRDGYRGGTAFFEKFNHGPIAATATTYVSGGGYRISTGTAATITPDAAQGGGIILTTGASNVQAAFASFDTPFQITSGASDLWWEARVEFDLVADNEPSWFIGLMDSTALGATVPMDNDGTIGDANLVGFMRSELDGDKLDTMYKANGVTEVVVKADAVTVVAATAVKIGMHFSTKNNKLTFFKNGVALADTKTIPNATGTDFPADAFLGLCVGGVSGSGAAGLCTVSWIRACQAT